MVHYADPLIISQTIEALVTQAELKGAPGARPWSLPGGVLVSPNKMSESIRRATQLA